VGTSDLDESPVNGESIPRSRSPGDDIFAGTVNLDAALEVEVTRGAETIQSHALFAWLKKHKPPRHP